MDETPASPWRTALNLVALLAAWELLGRFDLVASGALPGPSEIVAQFWIDRGDYGGHVWATVRAALIGFAAGNLVAILAAICFVQWPVAASLSRGINVTIFAIPPITLVPILIIAFEGTMPRILLAALSVYFPTMTAMLVGLTHIDRRGVDLIRAYAGGKWRILRWIRLRSSLPALLGGLRVAAPAAVLGAIIAEFGGGVRWGLGTYTLGSLGQANPARLWGIGLTATAIAGLAYLLVAFVAGRLGGATKAVTIAAGATPDDLRRDSRYAPGRRIALIGAAIVMPLLAWWGILLLLGISPVVARTPLGVLDYIALAAQSAGARARLWQAVAQSVPLAALGMAIGLAFAFGFAVLTVVWRNLGRALLPIALVTQSMPLVALTPLLMLLLGRGTAVTIAITVSVTFFPAFVAIAQGLLQVPKPALDLTRAYGSSWPTELRLVAVPSALPYLFAAARLAAPRALLGVMIAEWLVTGRGLGGLLNASRGYLDYGMIWTIAVAAVLLSIGAYQLVLVAERLILPRFGMQAG